jgi:hypothetical protein
VATRARDSKHIIGEINADDRRAGKGLSQQFCAVAWTTAKVENAIRLEIRNPTEEVTRRARALVLEFHIEGGIPIGHSSARRCAISGLFIYQNTLAKTVDYQRRSSDVDHP